MRSPNNIAALLFVCVCSVNIAVGDETDNPSKLIKHQITGLCSTERESDLREAFEKLPNIKLVKIDFENAEVSVEYDSAKAFPESKPEQIVEHFDNKLRSASNHTFGVKPLRTIAREKLKLIEIPVMGLDCKACSLGAYEAIYRLKGVEQATASFKTGKVTALINPDLIDHVELEMALKQRGVQIAMPESK